MSYSFNIFEAPLQSKSYRFPCFADKKTEAHDVKYFSKSHTKNNVELGFQSSALRVCTLNPWLYDEKFKKKEGRKEEKNKKNMRQWGVSNWLF